MALNGRDGSRRTRNIGSCDYCRKRKVKCDSALNPLSICSNCATYGSPCTHDMPSQKSGAKHYNRQITELQKQVVMLQERVRELEKLLTVAQQNSVVLSPTPTPSDTATLMAQAPPSTTQADEDDLEYIGLLSNLMKISLKHKGDRYFGRSSNLFFMHKVMSCQPTSASTQFGPEKKWTIHPWEAPAVPKLNLVFPPDDLLDELINLYFIHTRVLCIHQPSFRKNVAAGQHLVDQSFGALLLTMCALASRYSADPRVLLDSPSASTQSAGWKYYVQTLPLRGTLFHECPTLSDLQSCCLAADYVVGTSGVHSGWNLIGMGMRWAVELGYHRQRPGPPTVETEQQRRVFWTLLIMERYSSLFYGRPSSIRDEDFDVELPIDCDDEYWETGNSETRFKQPEGKPSHFSSYLYSMRLMPIVSHALRTIFSISKARLDQRDENLTLLDSMLNNWFNNIPTHLRWDPTLENNPYFRDSAMLYIAYYELQMLFHKTFVFGASNHNLPSLVICTHAARSQARLLELFTLTSPFARGLQLMNSSAFSAGIILSMNIRQRKAASMPLGQDLEDLGRCLWVLKNATPMYHVGGRITQTLLNLADIDCPLDPREWDQLTYFKDMFAPSSLDTVDILSGYPLAHAPSAQGTDPTTYAPGTVSQDIGFDVSVFEGDMAGLWDEFFQPSSDNQWSTYYTDAIMDFTNSDFL